MLKMRTLRKVLRDGFGAAGKVARNWSIFRFSLRPCGGKIRPRGGGWARLLPPSERRARGTTTRLRQGTAGRGGRARNRFSLARVPYLLYTPVRNIWPASLADAPSPCAACADAKGREHPPGAVLSRIRVYIYCARGIMAWAFARAVPRGPRQGEACPSERDCGCASVGPTLF